METAAAAVTRLRGRQRRFGAFLRAKGSRTTGKTELFRQLCPNRNVKVRTHRFSFSLNFFFSSQNSFNSVQLVSPRAPSGRVFSSLVSLLRRRGGCCCCCCCSPVSSIRRTDGSTVPACWCEADIGEIQPGTWNDYKCVTAESGRESSSSSLICPCLCEFYSTVVGVQNRTRSCVLKRALTHSDMWTGSPEATL